MNLAQEIPSVILHQITAWMLEFDRADAIERYKTCNITQRENMKYICEDIRFNTPAYQFDILTQSHSHLRLSMYLPDCNPSKLFTGLHIPESHIVQIRRRCLSCNTIEI